MATADLKARDVSRTRDPGLFAMTPSEKLVSDLCSRSFLSLWSYANPRRVDGRELCDALLVFGHRIVIFSVKEISLKEGADPAVAGERWIRKAVDASVDQLKGAQRHLRSIARVIRCDGTPGVDLHPVDERRVHLVAVAAGGKRSVPFAGGRRDGDDYVHVVDEEALREILGELDTTADFLHYLDMKERFGGLIVCEGEENLLALYLHGGRVLPADLNVLFVEDGLWPDVQRKPEFIARKEADRVSYWWDEMIERLIRDQGDDPILQTSASDHERVVRTMAAENRFARRLLSTACLDWLRAKTPGARTIVSPSSGIAYVFGTFPRDWPRNRRAGELLARCHAARSPAVTGCATVIGIGTEVYDPAGFSIDAVLLHLPEWTAADDEIACRARADLGILQSPTLRRAQMDEFPAARK